MNIVVVIQVALHGLTTHCRWVDQLFMLGCRRSLVDEDLYANPSEADAKYLLKKFNR